MFKKTLTFSIDVSTHYIQRRDFKIMITFYKHHRAQKPNINKSSYHNLLILGIGSTQHSYIRKNPSAYLKIKIFNL